MHSHSDSSWMPHVSPDQRDAFDAVFEQVYAELRSIAHHRLQRHRAGETLSTTALVHEAYLRLVRASPEWLDRPHFLALAARAMRFVLVDHAREHLADKRGGLQIAVTLDDEVHAGEARGVELLALNDALEELGRVSHRLHQVVEYRFFGGLTYEEIAQVSGASVITVKRDWQRARGWLVRFMDTDDVTS
jgi:RNA polymerase sigma factor (TIGR02999 family)